MTGRLVASVVWVPVVLVPALRQLLLGTALAVWPSIEPFRSLGGVLGGAIPFTVGVAAGFLATRALADRLIEALRSSRDPRERRWAASHAADGWLSIGGLALFAVIGAGLVAGVIEWHWLLVYGLVMVGLVGERRPPASVSDETAPLPEPRPLPDPPAEHVELLRCRWEWLAQDGAGATRPVSLDVVMPKAHYDEVKARDHTVVSHDDHAVFAREGVGDAFVGAVASQLRRLAVDAGGDALDEIHLVMSMMHSLTYASDTEEYGGEYPKFAAETLVDRRGDCEDFAILAAALLGWLGHKVALVLMQTGGTGHAGMAVGAPQPVEGLSFLLPALGVEVFYAEVTPPAQGGGKLGLAWKLGVQPFTDATRYSVYPIT